MRRHSFFSMFVTASVIVAGSSLLFAQGTAAPAKAPAAKPAAPAAKPAAAAGAARTIELTATETPPKFSMATIPAKPGETLKIVLKAVGTMPKMAMSHNFVLLKANASAEKFASEALMAAATEYIPASMKAQIIANTKLIGGGETAEVTFKVPAAPGDYPFLCSFAGHYLQGMKGTLVVK